MALARVARWSYRRRWMVLALWIVALIGINIVGKAVGNTSLEVEGAVQKRKGEAQEAVGKAKDAVKNIVDKA